MMPQSVNDNMNDSIDIIATIKEFSLPNLLKVRRVVLDAIKAKRPRKAARPKVRKRKSGEERERARKYAEFREVHCYGPCWRCGDTSRPLERAHITKDGLGKRLEDIRLINALCPTCHNLNTRGLVSVSEMLRIKWDRDRENFDLAFLNEHSVRRLEFPT